jgi:hypothetical protein
MKIWAYLHPELNVPYWALSKEAVPQGVNAVELEVESTDDIILDNGQIRVKTEQEKLEELKQTKLQEIAYERWKEETGGLTLPDGTVVKTDRESQSLLMGAALFAKEDPTYAVNWKGANGWVVLNADTILQLAAAVRQHVQACFDKEKQLTEKIMAATSIEELEAIKWE